MPRITYFTLLEAEDLLQLTAAHINHLAMTGHVRRKKITPPGKLIATWHYRRTDCHAYMKTTHYHLQARPKQIRVDLQSHRPVVDQPTISTSVDALIDKYFTEGSAARHQKRYERRDL